MNDAYLRHVIPEPQVLLGLALRPFSAGHIALLHRTQSAFTQDRFPNEEELGFAVFICAHDFKGGCAALNDPETPKFLRKWRKKLDLAGGFNLEQKTAEFCEYIQRGSEFPMRYLPKSSSNSISELPFLHSVRTALKHFYRISEAEFWDMPWGLALWDYYTIPVMNSAGELVQHGTIENAQAQADAIHKIWDQTMKEAGRG